MGVITTGHLPQGKVFGPIPKHITLTDPAYLIGQMTCDNRPDIHTVKLDLNDYSDQRRIAEWVPYIQPARDEREQNLEAFLKDGQLHYRVLHNVNSNEELLLWYHPDLAHMLGIPNIQAYHIKGGTYTCPYCMETFRYPNSIRAHMRFKCEQRKPMDLSGSLRPSLQQSDIHPHAAYPFPMHLNGGIPGLNGAVPNPYAALDPLSRFRSPNLPSDIHLQSQHFQNSSQHSPALSSRSTASQSTENPSPRHEVVEPPRRSPEKRPSSGDSIREELSPASKRVARENARNEQSTSPNVTNKSDLNQNVTEETISAFRKVEKQHLSPPGSPTRRNASPPTSGPRINNTGQDLSTKPDIELLSKNLRSGMTSLVPPFPFLPGGLPPPLIPNLGENLPLRIAEIYRNTFKMGDIATRTGDKLADIRNIENNNIPKVSFVSEQRLTFPLQYYKSQNPMVDKLLHAPSQPLTQNWCAKCNATFRMTSDLVYHMRSHHKSHMDPIKKKREEKLKCNVCGETFRERHHLTRHMSSHG